MFSYISYDITQSNTQLTSKSNQCGEQLCIHWLTVLHLKWEDVLQSGFLATTHPRRSGSKDFGPGMFTPRKCFETRLCEMMKRSTDETIVHNTF